MEKFANLTTEELVQLVKETEARADKAERNYQNQKIRAEKAEKVEQSAPVNIEEIVARAVQETVTKAIDNSGITQVAEDVMRQKEQAETEKVKTKYIQMGISADVVDEMITSPTSKIPDLVVEKLATKTESKPEFVEPKEEEPELASLTDLFE